MKKLRVYYYRPHPASAEPRDRRRDTIELDWSASGTGKLPESPRPELVLAGVVGATGLPAEAIEVDEVVPLTLVQVDVQIRRVPVPHPTRPTVEDRVVDLWATPEELKDVDVWARARVGSTFVGLHTEEAS